MAVRKTILVIDDEADFREILRARLEHEGYDVLEAGQGMSGLQEFRRNEVDLILLDIMMPGMDGFTFLKVLREEGGVLPIPPVITLTAYSRMMTEEKRKMLGDVPFVEKTEDFAKLLKIIDEMLG